MSVATQSTANEPAVRPASAPAAPWIAPAVAAALVVAATVAAFWPATSSQFLSWQDRANVPDNPLVRRQMLDRIWSVKDRGEYRPLALAWWAMLAPPVPVEDSAAVAPPPEPEITARAYHLANLGLAAAGSLLVLALLVRLTRSLPAATAGALLFAIHPWQAAVAGSISQAPQLLATVLGLAVLWLYFYRPAASDKSDPAARLSRAKRRAATLATATALFVAAILAAPLAIVVPVLAWAIDVGWLRRAPRNDTEAGIDWAVLVLWLIAAATFVNLLHLGTRSRPPDLAIEPAAALVAHNVHYLVLAVLAVVGGVVLGFRKTACAAAVTLVAIAPAVGWLPRGLSLDCILEPATSLALLGPALVLSGGLAAVGTAALYGAVSLLLALLLVQSHVRSYAWRDDSSLAAYLERTGEQPALVHVLRGRAAQAAGDAAGAAKHFDAAVAANPRFVAALVERGQLRRRAGQPELAQADFNAALKLDPSSPEANIALGEFLSERREGNEAIRVLRDALEFDPHRPAAHVALGDALLRNGDAAGAIASFQTALEFQPRLATAWLGIARANRELPSEDRYASYRTIDAAKRALAIDPQATEARDLLIDAHRRMSEALLADRQFAAAEEELNAILRVAPESAATRTALGNLLVQTERLDEAEAQYQQVLASEPGQLEARFGLGVVYWIKGRNDEAAECFRAVLKEEPEHAGALYQLAMVLSARGDMAPAIDYFRAALEHRDTFKLWPSAANNLAWILATCEDPAYRNGPEAMYWAQLVYDHYIERQPADFLVYVDTLAAAYAESELYPQAVDLARRAYRMAEHTGNDEAKALFRKRLELYLTGHPMREPLVSTPVAPPPAEPAPPADPTPAEPIDPNEPQPELDLPKVPTLPDVPDLPETSP